MKITLPIFALVSSLLSQASDITVLPSSTSDHIYFNNGTEITYLPDGELVVTGISSNPVYLPTGSTYEVLTEDILFKTPVHVGEFPQLGITGSIYSALVLPNTSWSVIQTSDSLIVYGCSEFISTDSSNILHIGNWESIQLPDNYAIEHSDNYITIYAKSSSLDSSVEDETTTPTTSIVIILAKTKPEITYPHLAVHNAFRNHLFSLLNYTHSSSFSPYINFSSNNSIIHNKENLHQIGGTVGFNYDNIGFNVSHLSGSINQYDLDSTLISAYGQFYSRNNLALSYGKHKLNTKNGHSFGILYSLCYNNFVLNLSSYQTKFPKESLNTQSVGLGYSFSNSTKIQLFKDFGSNKDQYGANQGSIGIQISSFIQNELSENLSNYLFGSVELRSKASSFSFGSGLEYSL
jgi:hypothetical protein